MADDTQPDAGSSAAQAPARGPRLWREAAALVLSLAAAAAAGVAGDFATTLLRGVNYSDVGVPMWSRGRLALLGGFLAFTVTAPVLLWAARRLVRSTSAWPTLVGAAASFLLLMLLMQDWSFRYG